MAPVVQSAPLEPRAPCAPQRIRGDNSSSTLCGLGSSASSSSLRSRRRPLHLRVPAGVCTCDTSPPFDVLTRGQPEVPEAFVPSSRPSTASRPGTAPWKEGSPAPNSRYGGVSSTTASPPGTASRPGTGSRPGVPVGPLLLPPNREGRRGRGGKAAEGAARRLLGGKVGVSSHEWRGISLTNDKRRKHERVGDQRRLEEDHFEETGSDGHSPQMSPKLPDVPAAAMRKRASIMVSTLDGHGDDGSSGALTPVSAHRMTHFQSPSSEQKLPRRSTIIHGEIHGSDGPRVSTRKSFVVDAKTRQSIAEIKSRQSKIVPMEEVKVLEEPPSEWALKRAMMPRAKANIQFKTPLTERLMRLDLQRHDKIKEMKSDRILEGKRRKFDALPRREAEAFGKAFDQYDIDDSGFLDDREAMECLRELGLHGATAQERRAIMLICADPTPPIREEPNRALTSNDVNIDLLDFALEVVPQVRQCLHQMRSEEVLATFFKYDKSGTGILAGSEALEIAREMGIDHHMLAEMQTRKSCAGVVPSSSSSVDIHGFQDLIAKGRERRERVIRDRERKVKECTGITDVQFQDFRADLVNIYDIFCRYDNDESGDLSLTECMSTIKEFGLMPKTTHEREDVEAILKNNDVDGNGEFSFSEFLELIREVRAYRQECCREQRLQAFDKYDRDKNGSMNHHEISSLLVDLNFVPKSYKEQDELAQLMQNIDVDGSGTIDFEEFQVLCQRIDEKLTSMQYEEAVSYAMKCGFSETQMREFRLVFDQLDADGSDKLEVQEVKSGLQMLKMPVSCEAFQKTWNAVDNDGSGELDFHEFLMFMKLMADGEGMFSEDSQRLEGMPSALDTRVLRKALETFRISTSYLKSLTKENLASLFCEYFHIRPQDDLAESLGVKSVGEIYELAVKRDHEMRAQNSRRTVVS